MSATPTTPRATASDFAIHSHGVRTGRRSRAPSRPKLSAGGALQRSLSLHTTATDAASPANGSSCGRAVLPGALVAIIGERHLYNSRVLERLRRNPASLVPVEDKFFAQSYGNGQFGYVRAIDAVGRDFIMRHYEASGGPKPPPIDHQGVEDVFIEKASVVWYFYQGQWLKLTGAD